MQNPAVQKIREPLPDGSVESAPTATEKQIESMRELTQGLLQFPVEKPEHREDA